jgi:Ca-activated chloride channel homolog
MISSSLMSPRGVLPPPPDGANDEMSLSARLITSRIQSRSHEQSLVVTITAPDQTVGLSPGRPPLALAIVIDRSGSMHGAPIQNAKAAAQSVLRQLDDRDSFAIVTYSSGSQAVVPMQRASDANKAAAQTAIELIDDDGGTCISCGLEAGAAEIGRAPCGGLRRLLLISDGQANEGIADRDELARLAANAAARGMSLSAVGVGLDFDERTMRRLAEVGRGNYYFVEDTVALSQMFVRELGTLSQTTATDVRLAVTPGSGAQIEEAYGYPMSRDGVVVVVPIADLRPGETRKVVFRVALAAARGSARTIARIDVGWRRVVDGAQRTVHAIAEVDIVDDPAEIAASIDRDTVVAVEQARSARALEDAAAAYDSDGIAGVRQVLERRNQEVRASAAYLGDEMVEELEAVSGAAIDGFATAPAQARKAASVNAYKLAR